MAGGRGRGSTGKRGGKNVQRPAKFIHSFGSKLFDFCNKLMKN